MSKLSPGSEHIQNSRAAEAWREIKINKIYIYIGNFEGFNYPQFFKFGKCY